VFANDSGLVWAKASNGSCATTDTIHIKTRSIPTLNLGRDSILCQGDSITLLAKTSTSKLYLWSDLSQDSFLQVKSTGLYWARIKDTMCLSLRDSIKITFQSKVPFSLGKDTSFCQGGSFLLVANLSGAKTWEWKDNSTASTYSAKNAGTQWVTVSNGTCVYSDTINLATYSIPSFSLGKDTILCKGATLNPISSAFPNTEYTWMGTSKGFNYSITTAGKYYVDLVDLPKKVCKTSDTINVTFQNPVKINLGKDTTLCLGQTIDLTVAQYGFKSFKWWDGNVNASTRKNNPALNSPAPHWVEGNTGVCISRDSIFIDYFLPLTINLGPDIDLCDNATKDFDITDPNASQYQWLTMTGTTLATSPKYTATDPGGFYIGMVSNGSCSKKDTVEVTYFTTPIVDLGPDIDICDDEPISLLDASTSGAASYLWVTGETTPVIAPSQKSKFEYWVKATNGICSASDSVWVYFTSSPELSFGFEDSVFCDAPNLSYDFTLPNTTFRWMDGFDQPIRKIKVSGEYWVVAENNCNSDSAYVSIKIDETGCRLYFPTGFSPNTDGRNDVWRPVGQVIEWVDLIVYNRWGEIIYKGNPSLGWNGTVNGVPVPDGLYPVSVSYRKSTNGYPRLYVKTIVLTVIK